MKISDNIQNKRNLDKYLFDIFVSEHTDLSFKIENNTVELQRIHGPRVLGSFPIGFESVDEKTYEKILPFLENDFIFCKPFSKKLKHNIFDNPSKSSHDRIEIPLFIEALSICNIEGLKKFKCLLVPKKANLSDYHSLIWNTKFGGKALHNILSNIPLSSYNSHYLNDAITHSFAFLDLTLKVSESPNSYAEQNLGLLDSYAYTMSKKEDFVNNFFGNNPKFFEKGANRVWFINLINKLEPNLNIKQLINEDNDVELFEEDTWKHATVEISKHGLYKNYPLPPSFSSYSSQSEYKSILSQFSTLVANNETKLKWGINVEQSHLGIKKNGNFLFSLAHSKEYPDKEKFQKILKSFLEYIKPRLIEESKTERTGRPSHEIFENKAELKKMLDKIVLFNDMSDNLPKNENPKRKNKI